MCMYIINEPKKLIAEEDIICYKVVRWQGSGRYAYIRGIMQPMQNIKPCAIDTHAEDYLFDMEHVVKQLAIPFDNVYEVYEGYHSYVKLEDAIRTANRMGDFAILAKFIIPKGTEYYCGIYLEYSMGTGYTMAYNMVSETIIYDSLIDCARRQTAYDIVYSYFQARQP